LYKNERLEEYKGIIDFMQISPILRKLLLARGITDYEGFLSPDYQKAKHDPYLLPDMGKAVERLVLAKNRCENVVIYGDYDIDGLTASSVLLDAFKSFGIKCSCFIPNRFVEGYGLSTAALEKIIEDGAQLIITVDCGSLSHNEIIRSNELGVDVIVTDHHSVAEVMPPAVAVINPKRSDHNYPFIDLAGVGVAFKLVQALQTQLSGLKEGQEKWLLDLVALGTVCDVVELTGENRANVYWGLEVMRRTRRVGLKALMSVSGVTPGNLSARSLGFGLGPRLNASGRLETAKLSLDLINEVDPGQALDLAERLDKMNKERRSEQDRIFQEAIIKAERLKNDPVLIVSASSWSHGIIGIVAAKLLEKYSKPTFVLQEIGDTSKGSARSYGDFSAVNAIKATSHLLIKGGGHKLAAGVTIETSKIDDWRQAVNNYYKGLMLSGQAEKLLPNSDVSLDNFEGLDEDLVRDLAKLEPFGNGNPTPVFNIQSVTIFDRKLMGAEKQHVKYTFTDNRGKNMQMLAFSASDKYTFEPGEIVSVWCELNINEWMGRRSVEGRLVRMELVD
jgi:single-stranded-DNA-specific exonuclease